MPQGSLRLDKQVIAEEPEARLDYYAIVDPHTLDPVADTSRGALVAVAAYVGTTRLIDNILLTPQLTPRSCEQPAPT